MPHHARFFAPLIIAVLAASCNSEGLPLSDSAPAPGGVGGAAPGTNTPTGAGATGTAPTVVKGGPGAKCSSACECADGLACFQGTCAKAPVPVSCCEAQNCTGVCQSGTDLSYGWCGSNGGGGPGEGPVPPPSEEPPMTGGPGGGNYCQAVSCMGNRRCHRIGCGDCDLSTHFCSL